MDRCRKRAASPSTDAPLVKEKRLDACDKRIAQEAMTPQERARERSQTRRDNLHELNATNSLFLRLPAEIRNMIYTYVFSGKEHNFRDTCDDCDAGGNCDNCDNYDVLSDFDESDTCKDCYRRLKFCLESFNNSDLGLLLVSRKVHAETALLPYRLSTFKFTFAWQKSYASLAWFLGCRTEQQIQAHGDIKHLMSLQGGLRYTTNTEWSANGSLRFTTLRDVLF